MSNYLAGFSALLTQNDELSGALRGGTPPRPSPRPSPRPGARPVTFRPGARGSHAPMQPAPSSTQPATRSTSPSTPRHFPPGFGPRGPKAPGEPAKVPGESTKPAPDPAAQKALDAILSPDTAPAASTPLATSSSSKKDAAKDKPWLKPADGSSPGGGGSSSPGGGGGGGGGSADEDDGGSSPSRPDEPEPEQPEPEVEVPEDEPTAPSTPNAKAASSKPPMMRTMSAMAKSKSPLFKLGEKIEFQNAAYTVKKVSEDSRGAYVYDIESPSKGTFFDTAENLISKSSAGNSLAPSDENGDVTPEKMKTAMIVWGIASTVSMAASAYHGYKRNNSVGWALGWGLLGGTFPVITPVIALAQGFGKKK